LRLHYLARMSFEAIARAYDVHRATAVRWLAAIRSEIDAAVRVRLWQELGVTASEFRSLWNAVSPDLDLSLSRLLGPE
jgi:RNA polymerase sigma-70 factor, ECF subfamily